MLAFLAQFTGAGALIGASVALYRDTREANNGDRRARIVTAWTIDRRVAGSPATRSALTQVGRQPAHHELRAL